MVNRSEPLAAARALILVLLAGCALLAAPAPSAYGTTIKVAVNASPSGGSVDFNIITTFPMTVSFSVNDPSPGASYYWQLGDGTNSTIASPVHLYTSPCVYNVSLKVVSPNGTVSTGGLYLGAFGKKGPSGATAVCPSQGTAGLSDVELSGGFFAPGQVVNITMNGAEFGTATSDRGGDWILNATGRLPSGPNGTQYDFTTSPSSSTTVFTTVEGLLVSPASGGPGSAVQVTGISYPADSTVTVFLGGVELGTAQTNGTGGFDQSFTLPFSLPLTSPGTYQFSTDPPALGVQSSFTSAGGTSSVTTTTPPPSTTPWWFWALLAALAALVAVMALVIALLWRRRDERREPGMPETGSGGRSAAEAGGEGGPDMGVQSRPGARDRRGIAIHK